jgi:membrane protease YdiL (CAAX protease family)
MLFTNPFFLLLSALFVLGKLATNLVMGASWVNALRSGLMGFMFYILACYIVFILSVPTDERPSEDKVRLGNCFRRIVVLFLFLLLILSIHVMNSYSIISIKIPIWSQISAAWDAFVSKLAQNSAYIEGTGLFGWPYLLLYVLAPALILWKSDVEFPKFFGSKTSRAALPFVAIYVLAFVFVKGITITNLLTLIFVLIWPALGEEFLFRGVIQRLLIKITGNPVTSIVLVSLLFAVSHIPVYLFGYSHSVVGLISALLPIAFTSFFWGYGYYRTGILWPWILIHALSNLVGF